MLYKSLCTYQEIRHNKLFLRFGEAFEYNASIIGQSNSILGMNYRVYKILIFNFCMISTASYQLVT